MSSKQKMTIIIAAALFFATAAGGYFLVKKKGPGFTKAGDKSQSQPQGKVLYTCPMHPFIVKDTPGACPICGMTLVKKIQESQQANAQEMKRIEQVSLSPTQMVIANVATVPARIMPLNKEINAVGVVQYDQARQAKVTAWVAGRLDKLYVNSVGAYVAKGKPVAEIYSPDLVAAQQEYLLALKSRDQLKDSPIQSIAQGGEGLVGSARQRLKLMGVKDEQIAHLAKAGEPNIRLAIYTPLSGVVVEKVAVEGQYVNVGDPLFNIADLSSVWVELEVYENDFSAIRMGQAVEITSQSYPGKTFRGQVSLIYPFLDPKTRTVKVRVQIPNPGLKLKPDMFVNALVKAPLGSAVTVPSSAVMDTGKRQTVWVEVKEGAFEPREVQVGARVGENVQILSGLKPGELVASSGGYLIDSEAQLKGGGHESMPGMKMDEPAKRPAAPGAAAPAAPPPPARKGGGVDMGDMKM